jgi:acyl carrier protein
MELQSFINAFETSVADLEPGTVTPGTAFKELKAWDSLAVLTVTDMIEMETGVLLRKSDFDKLTTVGDLHARVRAQM